MDLMGNETIVEISKSRPATVRELSQTKGVPRYHVDRYGRELVAIVRDAMAIAEEDLPDKNEPKPWIRDKALEARINKLKTARDRVAKELRIDGSVLAPRHILTAVATSGTLDVPAMREWQKTLLGDAFLSALKPEPKLF